MGPVTIVPGPLYGPGTALVPGTIAPRPPTGPRNITLGTAPRPGNHISPRNKYSRQLGTKKQTGSY